MGVRSHALELDPPPDRSPIDWKLVTNLPVADLVGAVEKLDWYALRWKAEVFHKVMKSGCRAEEARLQTAERLVKFLALVAVVSWRIFFLTMSARAKPDAPPDTVLTAPRSRPSTTSMRCVPGRDCSSGRSPPTSCRSPASAAISPATTIRLPGPWSYGAA